MPDLHAALDACSPILVNIEIKNSEERPGFDEGSDRRPRHRRAPAAPEPLDRWLICFDRGSSSVKLSTDPTALLTRRSWCWSRARRVSPWFGDLDTETSPALMPPESRSTWSMVPIGAMIDLGVDGICTDEPDLGLSLLGLSLTLSAGRDGSRRGVDLGQMVAVDLIGHARLGDASRLTDEMSSLSGFLDGVVSASAREIRTVRPRPDVAAGRCRRSVPSADSVRAHRGRRLDRTTVGTPPK